MAQASEQAQLIASLQAKGYSTKQIAALTGRTPRYITQARDSTVNVGRGGKVTSGKGQNLIPLLRELNERGKVSPASIPERRKTKTGKTAGIRKGIKSFTTKSGKQQIRARVSNGPATLNRSIARAARTGAGMRWDVNFKTVRTTSDRVKSNAWVSGQLPGGWTAQTLLDRIQSPQESDPWTAGDVNGALVALALEQNQTSVISANGPQDYALYTT